MVCAALSLTTIMERHDRSIQGPILQSTKSPRIGSSWDTGYKYSELNVSDITRLTESCPDLEELRLQFYALGRLTFYYALCGFSSLHSLVIDLHF
ncbi:uncharacterized protein BDW70DRAFT_141208 [Aspergillus foveolatus]|uniref:uncharacterized protein n=1 Tax=Aspergillus foveolatus TaxID=210207 RepID=UPI003CCDA63B